MPDPKGGTPAGSPPATPTDPNAVPAGSPSPGEGTAGAAQPTTDNDLWNQTPEPIRKELQEQRRQAGQVTTIRQQLEARGFTVVEDAQGNVHIVDPRPTVPAAPAQPVAPTADPMEALEAELAKELGDAELADNPETARAKAYGRYTRKAGQLLAVGILGAVAPQNNDTTIATFKAAKRQDPALGSFFTFAEPEFDRLLTQLKAEATRANVPLVITADTLESLTEMALGRSVPGIGQAISQGRLRQGQVAGQVAGQVGTAPGATGPAPTTAAPLDDSQKRVLERLAGGAALTFDKLVKRVQDTMKTEVS